MSGVGAFIAGAAIGAVVAKKAQKNHDKKKYHQQHQYQTSRTVVVQQPPHQVPNQTVVYVSNQTGASRPPQGYPHGYPNSVPHGPTQGYPPHGHPSQGYPHGHQPPHYGPPQSTVVYHHSVYQSPGYPPQIGFCPSPANPHGPPPSSAYPSSYPPPPGYSNPPAPSQQGGYPPAPAYDAYPPPQAPVFSPTPSGYPSNGYPPMPGSSQYPPAAAHPQPPSVCPFQPPSAHPQPASAAQTVQAHVTVQLTAATNQQNNAGINATMSDRRCFVLQNEETRYALHVDPVAGSKIVMRQRTATGSWDPQWPSGQGQAQGQGQLWYIDGEGIIRSQLNDFAIEAKGGGAWLCLAPYRGDSHQQWILRDGRILSNRACPSDCIGLEEGLMGTAVNADVIVTKYQAQRRHHHWVIEYV